MTKQEKTRLSAVLRATEYLFLENIALKLVLEHRKVENWHKLLERLVADKEMLAGVRLKFRDIYQDIEGSTNPSARTPCAEEDSQDIDWCALFSLAAGLGRLQLPASSDD